MTSAGVYTPAHVKASSLHVSTVGPHFAAWAQPQPPRQSSPARAQRLLPFIMSQTSLALFVVPSSPTFPVPPGMVSKFEEMVYNGSISQELLAAQDYLAGPAAQATLNHKQPLGVTVSKVASKDIC